MLTVFLSGAAAPAWSVSVNSTCTLVSVMTNRGTGLPCASAIFVVTATASAVFFSISCALAWSPRPLPLPDPSPEPEPVWAASGAATRVSAHNVRMTFFISAPLSTWGNGFCRQRQIGNRQRLDGQRALTRKLARRQPPERQGGWRHDRLETALEILNRSTVVLRTFDDRSTHDQFRCERGSLNNRAEFYERR